MEEQKSASFILDERTAMPKHDNKEQIEPNTWSTCEGQTFRVRTGPDYAKRGTKEISGPSLYQICGVHCMKRSKMFMNFGSIIDLPNPSFPSPIPHVPSHLIISCHIPMEAPSFWRPKSDGNGFAVVIIAELTEAAAIGLADLDNAPNSLRLWSEYCRRSKDDASFRGRFKAMGLIDNIEAYGLPHFIAGFNGKPALITRSGTIFQTERYIEMAINIFVFKYVAKSGLHALLGRFCEMVLHIGFVIEGRSDEELPEQILASLTFNHFSPNTFVDVENL